MAGCYLGHQLGKHLQVTLFEKSRGASGRLSTRRGDGFSFDHGAQFFTARSQQFLQFLKPYLHEGVVQDWQPKLVTLGGDRCYKRQWFEPHFVAVPTMSAWLKQMASDLEVRLQCTIVQAGQQDGKWLLVDDQGLSHGPFDFVISTLPAPQTAALFPTLAPRLAPVQMSGCYAWMLGFKTRPEDVAWEAAVVQNSPLSWLAWNDSKPGRSGLPALVVHSSNPWADAHIDQPQEEVQAQMASALLACSGIDASQATFSQLHRWRYAATPQDFGEPFLLEVTQALAAAGDWCLKGRLEGAFLSAFQLAETLTGA